MMAGVDFFSAAHWLMKDGPGRTHCSLWNKSDTYVDGFVQLLGQSNKMWPCNRLSRAANPKAALSSDETVSYIQEITFSFLKVSAWHQLVKLLHQSCVSCWAVDEASVRGVLFLSLGWIVCLWSFCCRWLTRPRPTTTSTLFAFSPHFLCDASVTCLTCLPVVVPPKTNESTTQISSREMRSFPTQRSDCLWFFCRSLVYLMLVLWSQGGVHMCHVDIQSNFILQNSKSKFASINMLQCLLYTAEVWWIRENRLEKSEAGRPCQQLRRTEEHNRRVFRRLSDSENQVRFTGKQSEHTWCW